MDPYNFTSFLNNSDFHSEMQKEDQEMRSLLASVTQSELPSNQFLSNYRNLGIDVGAARKLGRKMNKRKYGDSLKDKLNGKLGFALMGELLQECGQNNPTDHNSLLLQDQKYKMFVSQGFSTHWDEHPHSPALSSEVEQKGEVGGEVNTILGAEELSKVLNTYPTMQQAELYSESTDISNEQSSVLTDENIEFEMQKIALLFPLAEHDRGLGSCSWDNLPGIC